MLALLARAVLRVPPETGPLHRTAGLSAGEGGDLDCFEFVRRL